MVGGYECRLHYQETGGTGVSVYCWLHYWRKRRTWGVVCKLHYGGTGRMGEVVLYVVYTIGERENQGEVILCVAYTIGEWEEQG